MRRLLIACGFASLALAVLAVGGAASAAGNNGNKKDPSFRFAVLIKGEGEAFFKEVSGLKVEVDVIEVREGGANEGAHKIPGRAKWSNLVLKRGYIGQVQNDPMQQWVRSIVAGQDVRKEITIVITNQDLVEVARYDFRRCFPVKWEGPEFDATKSEVSIETIEIAHEGANLP